MSFRLVGDKYTEIKAIQKRRISELLASNIPEDEALLMRNGRYACLVCKHRPTFDTLSMLSLHRNGRKHAEAAHIFMMHRQRDNEEIEKRKQEKQLACTASGSESSTDSSFPLLASTCAATQRALLSSAPYSSLSTKPQKDGHKVEKHGEMFFSRKRTTKSEASIPTKKLHLHERCNSDSDAAAVSTSPERKPPHSYVFPHSSQVKTKKTSISRKTGEETKSECSTLTEAKRSHFVELKRSGWLLGPGGEWSKDPNVEFDSDEEEPSATEIPS